MTVTVSIGDVAKIQSRSIDPRKYPDTLFQLYSIPGFDNDKAPEQLLGSNIGSNKSILPQRGVLFSKLNPRINRVWVIDSSDAAKRVASTEFVCLVPEEKHLDLEFLAWRLRVPGVANQLPIAAAAATKSRQRIQPKSLLALPIPLPPLDEQRRIVGILNRAAKIERLRKQAADRLREFIPALFIKIFGSQNPDSLNWPVCTVEEILSKNKGSIRTGPFGSQLKHAEFTDQGVPVLGIDNVVANRFHWAKPRHIKPERYATFLRYRVFPGDLIVTIMGTTGRVCVAPEDLPECMSTKHLCVLTLNRSRVDPFFVWGALLFDESVRVQTQVQAKGQIMEGWNLGIVKRLQLRIPPLEAQRSFARAVTHVLAIENLLSNSSGTATELAASLLSCLL